ncbi:MAG: iron complex outermembrane receptor protein [Flavobacteriales bacterium]|jgi:iron complex outermembrane receptor protein
MKNFLFTALFLCCSFLAFSQGAAIRGKIMDYETLAPLIGVNVQLGGTRMGAVTDADGNYELLSVTPGNYNLEVTYLGFEQSTRNIELKEGEEVEANFKMIKSADNNPVLDVSRTMLDLIPLINLPFAEITSIEAPRYGVFSNSTVTQEDIAPLNNGQDLPYMLRFTPSVVTTSDAGAGIGYTGMRIRGTDQSRINVTINGIPYNDPESQGVFWVNLPDFATSADRIQIQRGVGTSTNGAGAFGGSVSVNNMSIDNESYAQIMSGVGSFNTFRNSVSFGTGKVNDTWSMEGRLSQITSDGYVDRASSDLKSYFLAGEWNPGMFFVKAVVFGGKERTYQSWYGTPESRIDGDEEGMLSHAANNGYSDAQTENLLNSGRTYNFYLYENEVDDYAQDHYQLHAGGNYRNFKFNVAGHYTYGRGHFEQFRDGDDFSDYGLNPIIVDASQQFSDGLNSDGDPISTSFETNYAWDEIEFQYDVVNDANGDPITNGTGDFLLNSVAQISSTDVIRRRWLENDFYGATYSVEYDKRINQNQLKVILGGAYNEYDGDHYGELIWMEHSNDTQNGDFYYFNNGFKTDFNSYLKANYLINQKLAVYGDLQFRNVTYSVTGIDEDLQALNVNDTLQFVNPKFGASMWVTPKTQVYGSYAKGNREPSRSDYVDAPEGVEPKHESMDNIELGLRRVSSNYTLSVNLYSMEYTDQLVLTGELNDVGTPIRTNVDQSYRRGVEAGINWKLLNNKLDLGVNGTYSQNKIVNFTEQVIAYDADFNFIGYQEELFEESDISFSPELIAAALVSYQFLDRAHQKAEVGWQTKYVGEQYLDNTSNSDRAIGAYLVNDFRLTYSIVECCFSELSLNFVVNNVLNEQYVNNGYTYSFLVDDTRVAEDFFYPQAGRNYMLGLTLKF